MRISFITTVFNEEDSIIGFLNSLFSQSKLPDEIVIVDGESTDNTVKKINLFTIEKKKFVKHIDIKIIKKKGNRSVGRNLAIENTSGEIITCSDAGCFLDKNWLKNIVAPFSHSPVDAVAGYYKGISQNTFEKSLIPYVLVMEDKIKSEFLPSTRSIAFRKSVWKKVGKFQEEYDYNEDYVFAKKLKKENIEIFFEKNAVVYWIPPRTLKQAATMFYRFAFGDAEARIIRPKVVFLFVRYTIAFLFLSFLLRDPTPQRIGIFFFVFLLYVLWSIIKNYKYVREPKAVHYLPMLQFVSDIMVLAGSAYGFIKSLDRRKK